MVTDHDFYVFVTPFHQNVSIFFLLFPYYDPVEAYGWVLMHNLGCDRIVLMSPFF